MPQIQKDISLKAFNSFHIEVKAAFFSSFESVNELELLIDSLDHVKLTESSLPILVLGGGSNMLFISDFDGVVLQNKIRGIHMLSTENDTVLVEVGAGVIWHDFVLYCIENGLGGVENLSLIPGTVGASPIQNIGAYGVEVKDVIEEVHVYNIKEKKQNVLKNSDCKFAYRSSIFKTTDKNKFVITSVVFRLSTTHELHLDYGAIRDELKRMHVENPSIKNVSDAIVHIRSSKLPDPAKIGNAGSFFKNPVVSEKILDAIKLKYEDVVFNKVDEGYKLAAGWLIEKAGWKGVRKGDSGVHEKQALVLVNHGNALGAEILELANKIQASVFDIFGVELETEVNVIQ